jgi:PAS domain S-box-containing protein
MNADDAVSGRGGEIADRVAQALVRAGGDAIVAADRDGRIIFWNAGAERMFGYREQDAVGRSLDIIIPERLRAPHWEGYARVMNGGESRYGGGDVLAVPAVRNDGRRISIEFTIVPLRDGDGRLTGLVAVLRDVTTRFEEMRALKRALAERGAGSAGP